MHAVERQLKMFSSAHRITAGYPGKCRHLHGHNYQAWVTIRCDTLNTYGFVMDFDHVSQLFDKWLQSRWDHATLVAQDDQPLLEFVQLHEQKHYIVNHQSSAEYLAQHLFDKFTQLIEIYNKDKEYPVTLVSVKLAESPKSCAYYPSP